MADNIAVVITEVVPNIDVDVLKTIVDIDVVVSDKGSPGSPGIDGREAEIQSSGTYIQWRYVGDSTWIDLVPLSSLEGEDGADGREVTLRSDGVYIQWQYVGDSTWTNLVPLSDLKGEAGTTSWNGLTDVPSIFPATPGGRDTNIQFNDNGVLGGVDAFSYDRLSGAITLGETVEVLPNVPLAVQKDIDDYVQVTFQNKSDDVKASMDIVITADNGTDDMHYLDIGVNSSKYNDSEYPVLKANDGYIDMADDNLLIGASGVGKKVRFYAEGYEESNVSAEMDADGINLPSGKTVRINGVPIGASPDFLALTDTPDSYTGQAGKVVIVNPAEDGLEFASTSGVGDMKVSVYDPQGIADDAFDVDNHTSGTVNSVFSQTEKTKLTGIADGAEKNVQPDWNQTSTGAGDYIKNKPTIPSGLTPASTVVSETAYGQAPVVGIATEYARADHTHGTPAAPSGGVSEEMAIAFSCAMGGI